MTRLKFMDTIDPEFKNELFEVKTLEDEIRVDHLCSDFLKHFYRYLVEVQKVEAEQAGSMAYGADYFLKEFIIPDRRENIFGITAARIRQFAGNWYIVKNLEPNMAELTAILQGVDEFYKFSLCLGKVSAELADAISRECQNLTYYAERIEAFWDISGDGYTAWEQACSLRD